jgi:hypothetical protein
MKTSRRCAARNRAGNRCGKRPIPGGTVCRLHGGGAPQVAKAARARLAALVDPAIDALGELLKQRRHQPARLGAVRDVLDRNGFAAPHRVTVGGRLRVQQTQTRELTNSDLQQLLQAAATGAAVVAPSTEGTAE